ncbi:cyclic nucleotide-binding domain-containing protein [Pontibacter sp. G13]|uniref:cyclic nucleotide-binding domain-containing protein n=1 Tax=Pontibacter sp. G13 TaxID=3074898 RepID=UPI002889C0ED|nr:cyclic nucleotide-binding domain-containing protein [Pontibacter sp. G13]WNJ16372.1 cyclic nucleotide-binding domain-containing protein [Pontibacter sp. G13]
MKRVLFVLGQLNDLDIDWMIRQGAKKNLHAGNWLIRQGHEIDSLYIVLTGEFEVVNDQKPAHPIAIVGAGEVLGEMSFIDARPPEASVKAMEDSTVFCVPKQVIREKMEQNPGFAARFYLAMSMFLSSRLRTTMNSLGFGVPQDDADEIDLNVLHQVGQAGARFNQIIHKFSTV